MKNSLESYNLGVLKNLNVLYIKWVIINFLYEIVR